MESTQAPTKKASKKSTKKTDTLPSEDVSSVNNTIEPIVEVESKKTVSKKKTKKTETIPVTQENANISIQVANEVTDKNEVEVEVEVQPKKATKTARASTIKAPTRSPKYMIVHCRHDGCYDFQYCEDEKTKTRVTHIKINVPKVFVFSTREEAQEFFGEYMNDVDVIDQRCKKDNNEIEHIDYCACGIIEMDDDDQPILFYNKRNQIFLIENSAQVFTTPQDLKDDVENLNLTNELIRKCRRLDQEQRDRYIELGRRCEACSPPKH
jgi:hypothetical protein